MSSIVVDRNGTVKLVYEDDLRSILLEGHSIINRVSHVEPTDDGQWTADMSPVQGPLLGPFETRAEAIQAEVVWIENNTLWFNMNAL